MSMFFVDSTGDQSLIGKDSFYKGSATKYSTVLDNAENSKQDASENFDDSEDESDCDFFGLPPPKVDLSKIIDNALEKTIGSHSKVEQDLEDITDRIDQAAENAKERPISKRKKIRKLNDSDFDKTTGKLSTEYEFSTNVEAELAKSVLKPGFEKLEAIPKLKIKKLRELKRIEEASTKGPGWFNMPATELTEEAKNDLKILQMRSVLDPKHFYKKNDLKVLPKYFQIGTVQHSPLDYYSERHTRKNKKHSLLEEVMQDQDVINYSKRKYREIVARRDKYAHRKALKKMKKLKKNKK